MNSFHPSEVVGRGSETQLQVGENLKKLTQRDKGLEETFRKKWMSVYFSQLTYVII